MNKSVNACIYLATLMPVLFVYLITTNQITVTYGMAFMVTINFCMSYIVYYLVKSSIH